MVQDLWKFSVLPAIYSTAAVFTFITLPSILFNSEQTEFAFKTFQLLFIFGLFTIKFLPAIISSFKTMKERLAISAFFAFISLLIYDLLTSFVTQIMFYFMFGIRNNLGLAFFARAVFVSNNFSLLIIPVPTFVFTILFIAFTKVVYFIAVRFIEKQEYTVLEHVTSVEKEKVTTHLSSHDYPDFIVQNGLKGLIDSWKFTTKHELYNPDYLIEEYLNDLDGREILSQVLPLLKGNSAAGVRRIVHRTDQDFIANTFETDCVWGKNTEKRRGWNRNKNWWYYRLPRKKQFTGFE